MRDGMRYGVGPYMDGQVVGPVSRVCNNCGRPCEDDGDGYSDCCNKRIACLSASEIKEVRRQYDGE